MEKHLFNLKILFFITFSVCKVFAEGPCFEQAKKIKQVSYNVDVFCQSFLNKGFLEDSFETIKRLIFSINSPEWERIFFNKIKDTILRSFKKKASSGSIFLKTSEFIEFLNLLDKLRLEEKKKKESIKEVFNILILNFEKIFEKECYLSFSQVSTSVQEALKTLEFLREISLIKVKKKKNFF